MVTQPPLPEPQELFARMLLRYGVEFLVIGGRAVQAHGVVGRTTSDLDVLLVQHPMNAVLLGAFLTQQAPSPPGFATWAEAAMAPNKLFLYPSTDAKQVDVLTSIDGVDAQACFSRAVAVQFGSCRLPVASRDDLIRMKQVSMSSGNVPAAHERDRLDIEALRQLA